MSVIADFQVNGLNPSTVGGLGTTAKYFPRILGTAGPGGGFSAAPSATSAAGQLMVPAFGEVQGQAFSVRAAGDVLPFTGGGTVTIDLVANTGTVASPSYAAIASTGAVTLASATPVNWFLHADLIGTNNSGATPGLLSGNFYGSVNNTLVDLTAITNPPTGLDFVKGQPVGSGGQGGVFGLVVRVTFNTSLAQNFARLYQFQVINQ